MRLHASIPRLTLFVVAGLAAATVARAEGPWFTGWAAAPDEMAQTPPSPPSGNVWVWSVNGLGEAKVNIYNADGTFNSEALAQLDAVLRCARTDETKAVDPHLYEMLSRVYDHYTRRMDIISGYRNQDQHLSKHYLAEAVDFHVPGTQDRALWQYVESLDTGGMGIGYYPNAGFVHMDIRPSEPSYRWIDRSGTKYAGWDGGGSGANSNVAQAAPKK
jgi:uncharacterized protein YcbK (DUF882 family)